MVSQSSEQQLDEEQALQEEVLRLQGLPVPEQIAKLRGVTVEGLFPEEPQRSIQIDLLKSTHVERLVRDSNALHGALAACDIDLVLETLCDVAKLEGTIERDIKRLADDERVASPTHMQLITQQFVVVNAIQTMREQIKNGVKDCILKEETNG